ncbi:MAG: Rne/Rng family ribonuclease, partial [Actinomycetota bacterium]|nr:Rne/Rng family ribonuclease [Actinomycetota bacterium]
ARDARVARTDSGPAPEESGDGGPDDAGGPGRKKRRRGGRGRSGGVAGRALGGTPEPEAPVELDEETLEKRRGRERKGKPIGRYQMCVQVRPEATQIAVLEGRSLIEHYVSRPSDDATQIHGNIYIGRVQNVLPGMEAAFVDIGTPKNAVLYRGDVQYDPEDVDEKGATAKDSMRIEQLLRPGQTVLCQVTKNPIGTKGARLTQEVSLAGRFVVLIPNSSTYGISKRLPDDERKRLRRILDGIRPAGQGLIVRTAAEGSTSEELRRDVERLLRQWQQIDDLAARANAPALLYREPPLAVRVIREEFNKDYRGVLIDDADLHREVHEYVAALIPELAERIELYDDPALPIFERQHVHEQLHKALDRKVWLPSGGSLIIERTEALTVIDVNTGKNVGTKNLEETVYRNNLEAAEEIARQLRLRDIGGIIVIDFIDMARARNRDAVLKTLRKALDEDRTKTFVVEISPLGLVEMTRQNVTDGVREIMTRPCPTCEGEGVIRSEETISIELQRRMRELAASAAKDDEAFLVRMNPRVSAEFTRDRARVLRELEAETGRSFYFEGSEGLPLDFFAVTRAGGRAEIEEQSLPFREGDEVLVHIVEPHMYAVDDAVAKIDGYIVSVSGGGPFVGEKKLVRVQEAGRTAATAVLVDPDAQPVNGNGRGNGDSVESPARRRGRRGGRRRSRAGGDAPAESTETTT